MPGRYNRLRQGYSDIYTDYKQVWLNIKINPSFEDAYKFIESEGIISEIIHLSKFLDTFKIATHNQIYRYLEIGGFSRRSINLDELVEYGFLNNFIIGLQGCIDLTKDEIFYSIGTTTTLFLKKYLNLKVDRVLMSELSLSPIKLLNRFDLVDFYINYINSYGIESVQQVELQPLKLCGKNTINIDAELVVKTESLTKNFIILTASKYTVDTLLPKTVFKLERALESYSAPRYFINSGKDTDLVILCESQDILEYVARKMAGTTFAKTSKLNLFSIDYLLRVDLSEYNITYSADQNGNVIEKEFMEEVLALV